jgi:hypothetical protein
MWRSPSPRSWVLAGTSTTPSSADPNQTSRNSRQLGSITASVSPLRKPTAASAAAAAVAASRPSANVRLVPSQVTNGASGVSSARRRSTSGTVVSSSADPT